MNDPCKGECPHVKYGAEEYCALRSYYSEWLGRWFCLPCPMHWQQRRFCRYWKRARQRAERFSRNGSMAL